MQRWFAAPRGGKPRPEPYGGPGLWFGTVAPAKGGLSCAAMSEANRNNAQGRKQGNPQGLTYIFINNIARIWSKRTQEVYHLRFRSVTRGFVRTFWKFV